MKTKLIQSDAENRTILRIIERLMYEDPEKDSYAGRLLKALAKEVSNYEKKYDRKIK